LAIFLRVHRRYQEQLLLEPTTLPDPVASTALPPTICLGSTPPRARSTPRRPPPSAAARHSTAPSSCYLRSRAAPPPTTASARVSLPLLDRAPTHSSAANQLRPASTLHLAPPTSAYFQRPTAPHQAPSASRLAHHHAYPWLGTTRTISARLRLGSPRAYAAAHHRAAASTAPPSRCALTRLPLRPCDGPAKPPKRPRAVARLHHPLPARRAAAATRASLAASCRQPLCQPLPASGMLPTTAQQPPPRATP
jgi:hypothetical protein